MCIPLNSNYLVYSSPSLIGSPLLPNNFVLIREVSFGERENYMYSQLLPDKNLCLF